MYKVSLFDVPAVGRSGFIFPFPKIHLYHKIPVLRLSPCRGPERYVLPVSGTMATETAETMKQSDDEGAFRASGGDG
ncbi:MAG TPA: hypothetical protein VJ350_04840 [Methanoregula sp.]|nr:hypothetical protein [Methanoregula sp.]